MSRYENPFDTTIRDPVDPEQALEDPLHGPEAVAGLLAIPPFRREDGTYHVFGGSYVSGTCTFDGEGRPFVKIAAASSSFRIMRESRERLAWIERFHSGQLPPRQELGYPEFRFNDPPYFIVER